MGTTSGGLSLPFPDDGNTAKGPEATRLLGEAVEADYLDSSYSSYTPTWTGVDGPPSSPTANVGRYRVRNGICDLAITMTFGPSTSGGLGPLRLSLPVPATALVPEQSLPCKLWVPSAGNFGGLASISASATVLVPEFPAAPWVTHMFGWQSASSGGLVGTGVPQIPGQYTVQNGGNFSVTGRYFI